MRYRSSVIFLIGIHVGMVTLEIYKHYKHTQTLFALQKAELLKQELIKTKQQRICALQQAQNLSDIEHFATCDLGLSAIRLPQVRTISDNNDISHVSTVACVDGNTYDNECT